MLYQHITDHCFDERPEGHGVTRACVDEQLAKLGSAFSQLKSRQNKEANPILDVPSRTDDLTDITELARMIRGRYKSIVVAGTGGSGLSGHTLIKLRPLAPGPVFHFLDNIDPDAIDEMFYHINLKDTCFLIISKSGSTVETLSQFYVLLEHVGSKLGKQGVRERFFIIAVPGDNPLRQSAAEYGLTALDHEPNIGGRYSILTKVGLLPAAIAGLDIKALRRGAQSVITQMDTAPKAAQCAPALGAAIQHAFITKNFPFTIMLPYSERLSTFSSWYRQNWAESLGKNGKGSTPIRAIGTTDQHSQLQLYLDGPKDKLFHMIMLNRAGSGQRIHVPAQAKQDYLHNKTTGDVMAAEQKATFESLIRHHCPVRLFKLESLKEEQMGALLMHFMLEIILTSALLEVNPFDQPAVEEGKILTREYLMTGNL